MGRRSEGLGEELRALLAGAREGLTGPEQGRWLDRVEERHEELVAVVRGALRRKDGALAGETAVALAAYWSLRGRAALGRSLLQRALRLLPAAAPGDGVAELRLRVLVALGNLSYQLGDYEGTRGHSLECLALQRARGDTAGVATALHGLASACQKLGEPERAREALEEALAINRGLGRAGGTAACLRALGSVYLDVGEPERARQALEEALALRQRVGDPAGIAAILHSLGGVCLRLGDRAAGRLMHEKALSIRRRLGDRWGIAHSLRALAAVAREDGAVGEAERLERESAALRAEVKEAERKKG